MKKIKYIAISFIALLVILVIFEKPILYLYYTYNAVEIETHYNDNLLLYNENIGTSGESKYVQYEVFSDETHIKLPHKTNILTIKSESNKSYVYSLQTCLERKSNYCFIFRTLPIYNPINNKTHRGDKLVILDKDGNEKCSFKSTDGEWILDYADESVLVYNSKENSFYYKNITSYAMQKILANDCNNYSKIILNHEDYIWRAYFYYNDKLVYQKTAPVLN